MLNEIIEKVLQLHQEGDHFTEAELREFAAKGILERIDLALDVPDAEGAPGLDVRAEPELRRHRRVRRPRRATAGSTSRSPIYSGPAYRAGLQRGDIVMKVDGWDTADRALPGDDRAPQGPARHDDEGHDPPQGLEGDPRLRHRPRDDPDPDGAGRPAPRRHRLRRDRDVRRHRPPTSSRPRSPTSRRAARRRSSSTCAGTPADTCAPRRTSPASS